MLSVWCLVPGNYPTARRLRPLRSLIEDRTIAEKSIDLILSRYLVTDVKHRKCVRKILQFHCIPSRMKKFTVNSGGDFSRGPWNSVQEVRVHPFSAHSNAHFDDLSICQIVN